MMLYEISFDANIIYNRYMLRTSGKELQTILPYFQAAAEVAKQATCFRARCGSVIVKNSLIIGEGFNGPALGDESNRRCNEALDLTLKPKYEKTCCIHAEWRAVIDACKRSGEDIEDSRLYFMRVDENGNFTDAGEPYCTTCSRFTLEARVGEFALLNSGGADVYTASEYNARSYEYYIRSSSL